MPTKHLLYYRGGSSQ